MRPTRSLVLAAAVLAPSAAAACGGFFRAESVVDQSNERVLFKQTPDGRLETWLDIRFSGTPESFAWVLPVAGVPETMETASASVLELLDSLTTPILGGGGCAAEIGTSYGDGGAPGGIGFDGGVDGTSRDVQVLDRRVVGAYVITTVGSTDAKALAAWLRENGYRVTNEMVPFIQLYLGQGLNFLAIKLLPGAGADAITPLRLVSASGSPMVPLRLASLAAEPETGVVVFTLSDSRMTPGNTAELEVPAARIAYDNLAGVGNWKHAVAGVIDDNNGEGLVVDYAAPLADLRASVGAIGEGSLLAADVDREAEIRATATTLLEGVSYVTRFYGRYSPEEMDVDLTFKAAPTRADVPRFREAPYDRCDSVATSCAFQSCGQGGLCVMTDGPDGTPVPACACLEGTAARAVEDDTMPGGIRTSCVDARMNVDPIDVSTLDIDLTQTKLEPLPDACANDPCGSHGECFALNGQQTCLCERGFVAVAYAGPAGLAAKCVTPSEDVPDDFYRRTLPDPRLPFPGMGRGTQSVGDDGCATVSPAGTDRSWAWLLLGLPVLLRRRWVKRSA